MSNPIHLDNRVVLCVDGVDSATFLNGLLTNTIVDLKNDQLGYGALLTPQGKIICDIILQRTETGFLLDVPIQADEALLKRLKMFKLKANVEISLRDDLAVYAFVNDGLSDPRHPNMPKRMISEKGLYEDTSCKAYHVERTKLGIAEQGKDFGENEVFPADVNMDINDGIDFKKGCFIGQEVVSRMKRRGTARRRTLAFHFPNGAPQAGTPLEIEGKTIGEVSSSTSDYALAKLRIDRLAKAQSTGKPEITANGKKAELISPNWLAEQMEAVTSS